MNNFSVFPFKYKLTAKSPDAFAPEDNFILSDICREVECSLSLPVARDIIKKVYSYPERAGLFLYFGLSEDHEQADIPPSAKIEDYSSFLKECLFYTATIRLLLTILFRQEGSDSKPSWKRKSILTTGSLNSLDIADLDHDGDIDIVTKEHKGNNKRVFILENDGRENFVTHIVDHSN